MQHQVIGPRPLPAVLTDLLPRYDRASLEGFITEAIDYLDRLDGDADVEPDDFAEEDDPSGMNDEDGWNTGRGIIAGLDDLVLLVPKYDADQSNGPNNEEQANREWARGQRSR